MYMSIALGIGLYLPSTITLLGTGTVFVPEPLYWFVGGALLICLLSLRVLFVRQKRKLESMGDKEKQAIGQYQEKLLDRDKKIQGLEGDLEESNQELEKLQKELQQREKKIALAEFEIHQHYKAIHEQNLIIKRKSQDTLESIVYAQQIQEALLPSQEEIKRIIPESFIYYEPRDIVSGDFYWVGARSYRHFVCAIDCTGHGVPGALLSMIANELLNKIIKFKGIHDPDKILENLQMEMRNTLKQKENKNEDGMDIGICVIHKVPPDMEDLFGHSRIEFAGARNSLIYIQNGELVQVRGDRVPIGGYLYEEDHEYTKHTVNLDTSTMIYLFSDGYVDQFGGEHRKKFQISRFRKLVEEIHPLSMKEQEKNLEDTLNNWRGNNPQLDDILVMGIRIDP